MRSPRLEMFVILDMVSSTPKRKAGMTASVTRRKYLSLDARHLMLFGVLWIVHYIVDTG